MQKLIAIALIFCCSTSLYCQQLSNTQIDSLVEHSMKAFDVPGIAVGIIINLGECS